MCIGWPKVGDDWPAGMEKGSSCTLYGCPGLPWPHDSPTSRFRNAHSIPQHPTTLVLLREMGRGPNMRPKCEWASLQDAIVSNGHPPTEASSDSFFPLLQTHAVADYDDDIPI